MSENDNKPIPGTNPGTNPEMNRNESSQPETGQTINTETPISWDENGQPVSQQFNDVYFSKVSGIEETRYVFLEGNQLPIRWNDNDSSNDSSNNSSNASSHRHFTIAETGFGTGLNFLCAWQLWRSSSRAQSSNLHFCSVEKFPLPQKDLQQALALWPELNDLATLLVAQYPPQPAQGFHRMVFDNGNVVLTIYFGEASEGFAQWLPIESPGEQVKALKCSYAGLHSAVDAWFLDGFAPAKNPAMWSEKLFSLIAQHSRTGTSFSTFTAAGIVRRGLSTEGFQCKKIKGFAHKREMLVGQFEQAPEPSDSETETPSHITELDLKQQAKSQLAVKHGIAPGCETSWHVMDQQRQSPPESICVIGAGLAGCQTAFALAQRHKKVYLVEKSDVLANAASGNLQGAVYGKLSPHPDPLSQFNLSAQIFANQFYRHHNFFQQCGQQCGVLHLAGSSREQAHYLQLAKRFAQQTDFARWIEQSETHEIAGLTLAYGGLLIPGAGWLAPRKLCEALSSHPNITILTNTNVTQLSKTEDCWQIISGAEEILRTDAVVVASAYDALQFSQTSHLPLKQIRGQVTYLPSTNPQRNLKMVVCGDGYIAPATHDSENARVHTLGATFTLKDFEPAVKAQDHQENLTKLQQICPDLHPTASEASQQSLKGRVGFRCTTPDYFPMVGPVADVAPFVERFAKLRRNASTVIDSPGLYHPGLYCNVGHGSRGLCYTPLCAELLASMICGELLPLSRDLTRSLHPGRFIVRDLARRKI
ncbi:tRNA 5-methylaminomethyl-2-thiouridine biosynthesis bifunctional protein MnmC [Thalassocella blandensis]|nr:tRNA 5-methylaminomethyl-2-thiouridine biosynthesis bifunctional protein MnmC [Thalassocella blandensis]